MAAILPEDTLKRIQDEIFKGRKIPAIKLYREATQSGLADAKNAVEQMEGELKAQSPEKFLIPPGAQNPPGMNYAVLAASLGTMAMGIYSLVASQGADRATKDRLSLAFSVSLTLMITLQGSSTLLHRQKPVLANTMLVLAFLLTVISVFRILHLS